MRWLGAVGLLLACGAPPGLSPGAVLQPEPPRPEPQPGEIMDRELSLHLDRCSNRTPAAEFTESSLPWLVENADRSVPALIELVVRGGGSTERAARVLGVIRAPEAVPALHGALQAGLLTHQSASARALWRIGGEAAEAALREAISGGGGAASAALDALAPLKDRDPCALVALGLATDDGIVQHHARQAAQRCGCPE
ncbi:MAG TPA: hypothetical protein ENK18_24000 [Deltaproteobacteria bacterium]|nr:hypothetical protein [Deltaproteobacteria bacterium]